MDASQLLDELSVSMYESPLVEFRNDGRISDLTNPLSIVMLLIDYETECSINGIVGYLGSSASQRLPETRQALHAIGCPSHADLLDAVRLAAVDAGMIYEAMQEAEDGADEFDESSFDESESDANDKIEAMHANVDWTLFWDATTKFVSKHMDDIQRQLPRTKNDRH